MPGKLADDKRIKVVIADSSSYVRLVLSDILGTLKDVQVVGTALSGAEAIRQVIKFSPDVLLIDLDLPQNSRLFTLQRIASECPTPVLLMTTTQTLLTPQTKVRLEELGVFAYVVKPANILQPQLRTIQEEFHGKLLDAAKLKMVQLAKQQGQAHFSAGLQQQAAPMHLHPAKVIVLGASTGGTRQAEMLVQWLPADFKGCLLVAIHMPDTFTRTFANRLKSLTPIKVAMARSGMLIEAGCILVARGGRDMTLKQVPGRPGMAKVLLSGSSHSDFDSPAIDLLMESVAEIFGPDSIGIILTGMGNDGTLGMSAIARAGGKTAVQDQQTTGVFGMAKSALRSGIGHQVLSLPQIASFIDHEVLPEIGRPHGNQRTSS